MFAVSRQQTTDLVYKGVDREIRVSIVRLEPGDLSDMDCIPAAGVEPKPPRLEKPFRVPNAQHRYGCPASSGDLENAHVKRSHPAVPASPSFRENDDVAAMRKMFGHGFDAV